jgi:hypothetical protein
VEAFLGNHVDLAAKQIFQLLLETEELDPDVTVRLQDVEEVDIASSSP